MQQKRCLYNLSFRFCSHSALVVNKVLLLYYWLDCRILWQTVKTWIETVKMKVHILYIAIILSNFQTVTHPSNCLKVVEWLATWPPHVMSKVSHVLVPVPIRTFRGAVGWSMGVAFLLTPLRICSTVQPNTTTHGIIDTLALTPQLGLLMVTKPETASPFNHAIIQDLHITAPAHKFRYIISAPPQIFNLASLCTKPATMKPSYN